MSEISCVIVSYNNISFLEKAILSVVNQTHPVKEVVIADDASTDGSRHLIKTLAKEYQCIRPILREKNLGVAANRDLAIRSAKCDLVTTLDGDDWYTDRKIEWEVKALRESRASVAYSSIQIVNDNGEKKRVLDTSGFSKLDLSQRLKWIAFYRSPLPRDMLFLRKTYLEVGGMNHNLKRFEDRDYKIRLVAGSGDWAYSGIIGVNYRKVSYSLSDTGSLQTNLDKYKILSMNSLLFREHIGNAFFEIARARLITSIGKSALDHIVKNKTFPLYSIR